MLNILKIVDHEIRGLMSETEIEFDHVYIKNIGDFNLEINRFSRKLVYKYNE